MNLVSIRLAAGVIVSISDELLAGLFILTGALVVYLVLFDQGALAGALLGATAGRENLFHEFFHDGRHLNNAPCH